MYGFRLAFLSAFLFLGGTKVHAQTSLRTSGTLVIVPASGEVRQANDEAHITFMIEEQDRDKAVAASRVNQKMRQGIDIVKHEDSHATMQTRSYYTYPIYAEESPRSDNRARQLTAWRVGQYLDVTTANLKDLPRMVSAAQRILGLNGLQFSLTEAANRKLDEKRIEVTYRNLNQRVAAIAKAMGRDLSDVVLDTMDFEGSGAYAQQEVPAVKMAMRASGGMEARQIEEPSFEPGETILHSQVVAKIRFK